MIAPLAIGFVFLAGPGLAERPAGTPAEKWSEKGKSLERSADEALSNARPKGEARGFWSRLFGGGESE